MKFLKLLLLLTALPALAQAPEIVNCRRPSASCYSSRFLLLGNGKLCLDGATCSRSIAYDGTNINFTTAGTSNFIFPTTTSNKICLDSATCAYTLTYNVGSTRIDIVAAGVPAGYIDNNALWKSNGDVSSTNRLYLDGSSSGNGNYSIRNAGANTLTFRANAVDAFIIDASQNLTANGQATIAGRLTLSGGAGSGNNQIRNTSGAVMVLQGGVNDGASAVNVAIDGANTLSTAGARLLSIRNNTVEKAFVDFAGYIASITPFTLDSFAVNGSIPAGAQTYGKIILPARAFTVTALTYETSVAAVGAGTHTWQITDGTNLCNCAASCASEGTGTALRLAACSNAGGAGCAFPNTQTTISYTTLSSTCAVTQATVLGNVRIEGNWQ